MFDAKVHGPLGWSYWSGSEDALASPLRGPTPTSGSSVGESLVKEPALTTVTDHDGDRPEGI